MPTEHPRPHEDSKVGREAPRQSGFEGLSAHLKSIALKARSNRWPGWTEEDARAVAAAAREIEEIPRALAAGMREAFDVGRQYGHGEEELDRLNLEIQALSSRLARQAWGGAGPEERHDGGRDGTTGDG